MAERPEHSEKLPAPRLSASAAISETQNMKETFFREIEAIKGLLFSHDAGSRRRAELWNCPVKYQKERLSTNEQRTEKRARHLVSLNSAAIKYHPHMRRHGGFIKILSLKMRANVQQRNRNEDR